MFITETGEVGFCDKKLGSLNINHAVKDAMQLQKMPLNIENNKFTFNEEVSIGKGLANELRWSTAPQFARGKVLYKVLVNLLSGG
jgi:hypothetical protein